MIGKTSGIEIELRQREEEAMIIPNWDQGSVPNEVLNLIYVRILVVSDCLDGRSGFD